MKWETLKPPPPLDHWPKQLAELRAEQHHHPEEWGELHTGARSTVTTYAKRLRQGVHPVRPGELLNTAGYQFRTQALGDLRGRLWGRWVGTDDSN